MPRSDNTRLVENLNFLTPTSSVGTRNLPRTFTGAEVDDLFEHAAFRWALASDLRQTARADGAAHRSARSAAILLRILSHLYTSRRRLDAGFRAELRHKALARETASGSTASSGTGANGANFFHTLNSKNCSGGSGGTPYVTYCE